MKKHVINQALFAGIMLLAQLAGAFAQQPLSVMLTMSPRPSPYISDWSTKKETTVLTIRNVGPASFEYKLEVQIKKDDILMAETKWEEMDIYSIPRSGTQIKNGGEIAPLHAVRFLGESKATTMRTGMLPSGAYEICIRLLDVQTRAELSQQVCRSFQLVAYEPPKLLSPGNNAQLKSDTRPLFRWTPVSPNPGNVKYRLRIFEILPGQTPMHAFRGNQPIVEKEIVNQTQMTWPPEFTLPEREWEYIWTVQSLDNNGNPLGENDGYAEPWVFEIISGNASHLDGQYTIFNIVTPSQPVELMSDWVDVDTVYLITKILIKGNDLHNVEAGFLTLQAEGIDYRIINLGKRNNFGHQIVYINTAASSVNPENCSLKLKITAKSKTQLGFDPVRFVWDLFRR